MCKIGKSYFMKNISIKYIFQARLKFNSKCLIVKAKMKTYFAGAV